jgi:hypothetical protein
MPPASALLTTGSSPPLPAKRSSTSALPPETPRHRRSRRVQAALFAFFTATFWLLALSWTPLALFSPMGESRPYVYALRLLAFLLIIVAMIHKNRQA